MNSWAEEAVRDAIEMAARAGRNDLASDLGRILSTIGFEDLDIMRNPDADPLADEILEAASISELIDVFRRLAGLMKVRHCTMHVVTEAASTNFTTKALTTYPEEWITRYVDRRYFQVDPVIHACRQDQKSFFWHELESSNPVVRTFWEDAKTYGIGPSGFTLSIITERGDQLALSVSDAAPSHEFAESFSRHVSDLFGLGIFLADAFCRLASKSLPKIFNPTDDQIMVLRAIAEGVEEEDLEKRNYLFGSYKTVKRSIITLFQTNTVAQAAVLAARIGLFDNAPLTKADILAASEKSMTTAPADAQSPARKLVRLRSVPLTSEPVALMGVSPNLPKTG